MKLVKPFVKWAGGKGSLISQLKNFYPFEIDNIKIDKYVEPFVGGGAVLINILQKYDIKEVYAFDINMDLINCYNVIKSNVEELIEELEKKENLDDREKAQLEMLKKDVKAYSSEEEYRKLDPTLEKFNQEKEKEKNYVLNNLNSLKTKLDILKELEKEKEGLSYSVKKILEEKEKNTYFGKKVDNILANVISTDKKYILAFETALRIYNAKYNC